MRLAHGAVAPSELAGSWSFDPLLIVGLAAAIVLYRRGNTRLAERGVRSPHNHRAVSFYGGLAILAGALLSPLDALASTLFSAHMVQHLLLMLVAAPLLVHAKPTAALIAGLPSASRGVARRARGGRWREAARAVSRPDVVGILGALALWAWHMPALYEAALSHAAIHAAEHVSFLAVAVLFWNVVLTSGTRRGTPRPIALLLVLANGVQGAALGAILVFASSPLYRAHDAGARLWDRSPLGDQQLAGALMWGPPALLYFVVMGWLFVRWFAEMDESSAALPLVGAGGRP